MTTNIYILADLSIRSNYQANKMQGTIAKMARALSFINEKTDLHIIGYNDKARILAPYQRLQICGNPNLGEGLDYLKSVMRYVQKYNGKKNSFNILVANLGKRSVRLAKAT